MEINITFGVKMFQKKDEGNLICIFLYLFLHGPSKSIKSSIVLSLRHSYNEGSINVIEGRCDYGKNEKL